MDNYEKGLIENKREYIVSKSNQLIQKNRFALSLTEQKTIAFICSMIKPIDDKNVKETYQLKYVFSIKEYCQICGIDHKSGKNMADIKNVLKKLSDKSMWLEYENGEVLVRWLSKIHIERKGSILIEIDQDLVPYLFDLKQRFMQYQLYNILAMESAFSIRIYELLKSYAFQKQKSFDVDELKKLLCVENLKSYDNYANFKKKVLEKAKDEINELSDLMIDYIPIKKGNKVVKIKFIIETKKTIEAAICHAKTRDIIDKISFL